MRNYNLFLRYYEKVISSGDHTCHCCNLLTCLCQRLQYDSFERGQHEFSLLAAYGENYRIPEAMKDQFSFGIVGVRYGWFTSPRTELFTDLSVGSLKDEHDNHDLLSSINYRRFFAVRGPTALSYDMSFGLTHFDDTIPTQGTKTNFCEQLGVTYFYATGRSSALSLGYTFSHTSNAGIKLPNLGINATIVSIGQSWYR